MNIIIKNCNLKGTKLYTVQQININVNYEFLDLNKLKYQPSTKKVEKVITENIVAN